MTKVNTSTVKPSESPPTRPTRILIVDDHYLVRYGMRLMINNEPGLEVCGEAEDETQAVQKYRQLLPDLVIVDISLHAGNGIELIKRIKAHDSQARIIVSSMHDERIYGERALRAGAVGYVGKQDPGDTLLVAIRQVLDGEMYFGEQLTQRILRRAAQTQDLEKTSPVELLTDRELEAFHLIGEGVTSRDIASRMHISRKTVDRYRENIKRKLNIRTSSELTHHATLWLEQNR